MKTNLRASIITAVLALLVFAGGANAALMSQLGVLDLAANGGINPTTGAAWANGDTYRLIFSSSVGRTATATDINDYNGFIQNLANNAGLGGATWKAIGSTANISARDNTNTNAALDGTGESIFLMNGSTVFSTDYVDLYSFKGNSGQPPSVDITISETGGAPFDGGDFTSVWTGSTIAGDIDAGNPLGDTDGTVRGGLFRWQNGRQWINRFTLDPNTVRGMFGLSDVLTVTDPSFAVPEPATATLAMLGLGGLVMRRRRNAA